MSARSYVRACVVILLAVCPMLFGAALAAGPPRGTTDRVPPPPPIWGLWRDTELVEALQLSSRQVDEIRAIDRRMMETLRRLHRQIAPLHRQVEMLFTGWPVDAQSLNGVAEQLAKVQQSFIVQVLEGRRLVHNVLESWQHEKLTELGRRPSMPPPCLPPPFAPPEEGRSGRAEVGSPRLPPTPQ